MWLKSNTRKPQWFQYLKLVFLEIANVTIWSVFWNQVTYAYTYVRTRMTPYHTLYILYMDVHASVLRISHIVFEYPISVICQDIPSLSVPKNCILLQIYLCVSVGASKASWLTANYVHSKNIVTSM